MTTLVAALAYAARGWPVFPCKPGDKRPATKHGLKDATTDEARLRAWFDVEPAPNIGLVTGAASGLVVVDLDRKGQVDGLTAFAALCREHNATLRTCKAETPSGGLHLFFKLPGADVEIRNSASKIAPGVDVRATGGYVVAAPSTTSAGTYRWLVSPDEVAPAEVPYWLFKLATADRAGCPQIEAPDDGGSIPTGQRNATLASLAGAMRRRNATTEEIEAALLVANARRCSPPLPDVEVQRIASSVARYPAATSTTACPVTGPTSTTAPASLVLRCVNDVEAKPISWLWPDRFARGELTTIAGIPGLGKTMLSANMGAIVSTGGRWPTGEQCDRGSVVILSAEDSAEHTLRPRLEAAGADLTRCFVFDSVRELTDAGEVNRGFNLAADVDRLNVALEHIGDVALVVLDPVNAFLGKVDSHKDAEVRSVLAPLAALAQRRDCCVVTIAHLTKNEASSAINRVGGSIGFVAAARAVWCVARDRDDESLRVFGCIKNNLAPDRGLAKRFSLVPATVGIGIQTCRIEWQPGDVRLTADELLAPQQQDASALDRAKDWLTEHLSGGVVGSKQIIEAAKGAGIAERTLRRALTVLGGKAVKGRFDGGWSWSLAQDGHADLTRKVGHLGHLRPPQDCQWPSSTPEREEEEDHIVSVCVPAKMAKNGVSGVHGNLGPRRPYRKPEITTIARDSERYAELIPFFGQRMPRGEA